MYRRILAAVDGSPASDYATRAALTLAEAGDGAEISGCHVYAARLHRTRFEEMEPGLPERYQEEERLGYLRNTHEGLISQGMELISDAYLSPLAKVAGERGIPFRGLVPEGRNYVELLRIIREERPELTVMGAVGQGLVPEMTLGSCAERVLLYAPAGDVLVMRRPWNLSNHPIVVGVDGSENSFMALKRGMEIARHFGARLEAVAVYDPFFHTGVFRTIADILPEEAQKRFDFASQERLHNEIIDRGLEQLYRENLERGLSLAESMGVEMTTDVVAGKVCTQLHHYAALRGAGLLVLGRWGLHREKESLIGSNTLAAVRMSSTNVLVTAPSAEPLDIPELPQKEERSPLAWTEDAEKIMERIPPFARKMARGAIEEHARSKGADTVTKEIVDAVSKKFGMGG